MIEMDAMAWFPHPKTYEPCHSCNQWKVLVWLHMCGPCAMVHKHNTDLAAAQWKKDLAELEAQKQHSGRVAGK